MNLKDIMAISGEPGLFRFKAQGKNAIIVEDIETGRRSSAFASSRVSSLEDISIFTDKEDMPLAKVLDKIYELEKGGAAPDSKSSADQLKAYFETVLPEYNKEKVYASDIKKVIQWYNLLHKMGLLIREEPEKNEDNPGVEAEAAPEKPAKKTKKK
jgi:hypothetical protein